MEFHSLGTLDSSNDNHEGPLGAPLLKRQIEQTLYRDLHERAEALFQRQPSDHTLQPTALVHEAYLKIDGLQREQRMERGHLLALATTVMRQVLVDHARAKGTARRGGHWNRIPLGEQGPGVEGASFDALAFDEALKHLAQRSERQSKVAELRFLGGLSVLETAEALHISPRTVELDSRFARAWLTRELEE